VLPKGVVAEIDAARWPLPPVFQWIMREANLPPQEMSRTFNCGIGMIAVVDSGHLADVTAALESDGDKVYEIGRIAAYEPGRPATIVTGSAGAWDRPEPWTARSGDEGSPA
jgi:phosphoribosylformylglycinamidine cyclo-ligase